MKPFLYIILLLSFIGVVFTWKYETTLFWESGENRTFIVNEIWKLIQSYSWIFDSIRPYMTYVIVGFFVTITSLVIFLISRKKKIHQERNPLNPGKTIVSGDSILSKKSLPTSENKQKKASIKLKNSESSVQTAQEKNDLDIETMQKMLNKK